MKCPDCNVVLEVVDFRGIKIQECGQCQGRWFARQELNKAKDNVDDDLRWLDFDPFVAQPTPAQIAKRSRTCPQCVEALDNLNYEDSQVNLARCTHCQGVWVPQGEFEKLIKYLENIIVSKSAPEYVKDSFKQFLEIATGKEEVTEELKDFLVVLKLSEERLAAEHPHIARVINKIYEYLPFL